jgi:hypothetical protein
VNVKIMESLTAGQAPLPVDVMNSFTVPEVLSPADGVYVPLIEVGLLNTPEPVEVQLIPVDPLNEPLKLTTLSLLHTDLLFAAPVPGVVASASTAIFPGTL